MAATFTEQYRPVASRRAATDAGLDLAAVRDMELFVNNWMRYTGPCKVIGQPMIPPWYSEDAPNADENVLGVPFAPFKVPHGINTLAVSIGHEHSTDGSGAGTSEVAFRVYACFQLYKGDMILESNLAAYIGYGYTYTGATDHICTGVAGTHSITYSETLRIPKQIAEAGKDKAEWVWLLVTAENDAGDRAYMDTFDVTPIFV